MRVGPGHPATSPANGPSPGPSLRRNLVAVVRAVLSARYRPLIGFSQAAMRTLLIIGIGAGDPDHLTLQAIRALNRANVFFIPDKGAEKADLHDLRTEICERFIENDAYRMVPVPIPPREGSQSGYRDSVERWHAALAQRYAQRFVEDLGENQCGALLVWGDPGLYDSTIRLIETIRAQGLALDFEVIPGITSVQALTARHRIPLNHIGEPVLLTTGRRLSEGIPAGVGSIVVMLDGEQAFSRVPAEQYDIFWGAYLGTKDEILIAGPLADVCETILRSREEARAAKGWIMDTYLLRRRGGD
jgi:precorrin-6A synthase